MRFGNFWHTPNDTLTAKISLTRRWFDGRLKYKHIKNESGTMVNTLLPGESAAIWYPRSVNYNIRKENDVMRTDVRTRLEVIPGKEFKYVAADNMHIFDGSENALSLTKEFSVDWKCNFVFHWYPFDTQMCRMELACKFSNITVQPSRLEYNHKISLSRFTISKVRMCKSVITNMKVIIVEVTLERPIVNFLLTVFVPTILLVIISFAARFFC